MCWESIRGAVSIDSNRRNSLSVLTGEIGRPKKVLVSSRRFNTIFLSSSRMPERFHFSDLRELFARANEEKSGDQLAGIAAASERERVAAKEKLADLTLAEIVEHPLIDPDEDDVSRLILDSFDREGFRAIHGLTVGEFREHILDDATGEAELQQIQWAIIPEIAAAVAKI